jgi:hypothetical protein
LNQKKAKMSAPPTNITANINMNLMRPDPSIFKGYLRPGLVLYKVCLPCHVIEKGKTPEIRYCSTFFGCGLLFRPIISIDYF